MDRIITHVESASAEVEKLKTDAEFYCFSERIQYQLSPIKIHFLEAFEAEQKKLKGN